MENDRQSEWMYSSFAFMNIEMLLLGVRRIAGNLSLSLGGKRKKN
ncbi:MAG: hypothetical protein Q8P57_02205 [Candidatus Pacearchaeota archaeon]|nr:hypothetical protein [Candidatus Pacearchaeota archaeon]